MLLLMVQIFGVQTEDDSIIDEKLLDNLIKGVMVRYSRFRKLKLLQQTYLWIVNFNYAFLILNRNSLITLPHSRAVIRTQQHLLLAL